jgi:hypothetical protein
MGTFGIFGIFGIMGEMIKPFICLYTGEPTYKPSFYTQEDDLFYTPPSSPLPETCVTDDIEAALSTTVTDGSESDLSAISEDEKGFPLYYYALADKYKRRKQRIKKRGPLCRYPWCKNHARRGGVCVRHGAKKLKCEVEGCVKNAQAKRRCNAHGAPTLKCYNCNKAIVKQGGLCKKCNDQHLRCLTEGCGRQVPKKGDTCKKCQGHRKDSTEFKVLDFLKKYYDVVHNKTITYYGQDLRPDFTLYFKNVTIIIENDEQYHGAEDIALEVMRNRMMLDYHGEDSTYIIRFNPDAYVEDDGVVSSNLDARLNTLKQTIDSIEKKWKGKKPSTIPCDNRVIHLYYPQLRRHLLESEMFYLE